MDSIENKINKILSTWAAIGVSLIAMGSSGFISLPDILLELFSQDFVDRVDIVIKAIISAIGAAITFAQYFRANIISNKLDSDIGATSVRSSDIINRLKSSPFA